MIPIRACISFLLSILAGFGASAQDTLFFKSGTILLTDVWPSQSPSSLVFKQIRNGKVVLDSIPREEIITVGEHPAAYFPGLGAEVDKKKYKRQMNRALRKERDQYSQWNPLHLTYRINNKTIQLKRSDNVAELHKYDSIPSHLTHLVLIDRKPRKGIFIDTLERMLYYREPGTLKLKDIEQDKVFAMRTIRGIDRVMYVQDTLENNWLSATEMHEYIDGQYDAMRFYRIRPNLAASLGLLVGGAGSNLGMFYGPLSVIVYTGIVGFTLPGTGSRSGYDQSRLDNEAYREGFSTAAKRKAARRSALFTGIGYLGGLTILTLILP